DDTNSWCNRLARGNPYAGATVFDKENNPVGHVVIGGGELAYFGTPEHWGKGYCREAAIAWAKAVLPAIEISESARNVNIPPAVAHPDNKIPPNVEATAHPDNKVSIGILEGIGMIQDP